MSLYHKWSRNIFGTTVWAARVQRPSWVVAPPEEPHPLLRPLLPLGRRGQSGLLGGSRNPFGKGPFYQLVQTVWPLHLTTSPALSFTACPLSQHFHSRVTAFAAGSPLPNPNLPPNPLTPWPPPTVTHCCQPTSHTSASHLKTPSRCQVKMSFHK